MWKRWRSWRSEVEGSVCEQAAAMLRKKGVSTASYITVADAGVSEEVRNVGSEQRGCRLSSAGQEWAGVWTFLNPHSLFPSPVALWHGAGGRRPAWM